MAPSSASSIAPPSLGELAAPSATTRAAAVGALGDSPRPEHAAALFAALDDPSWRVRRRAIEALASLARAHERARGTVRRVLTRHLGVDPRADLRGQIAAALAQLDAPLRPGALGAPRTGQAPANDVTRTPANDTASPATPRGQRQRRSGRPPLRSGMALRDEIDDGRDLYDDESWDARYEDDYYRYDYDKPPPALPPSDGLAPLGAVEALVQRLTLELHDEELRPRDGEAVIVPYLQPAVAQVLSPSAYGRLAERIKRAEAERGARRPTIGEPSPRRDPEPPVATLPELAKTARLRRKGEALGAEPDWAALKGALLQALAEAPPSGEAALEAIVLAFHEVVARGPADLRRELSRCVWHDGWASLACWLSSAEFGHWRARARQASGSWLALHNLREATRRHEHYEPLLTRGLEQGSGTVEGALALLTFGGGSLRSLDYPEFRVVGHVALVDLKPEQEQELGELAEGLNRQRQLLNDARRGPEALLSTLSPELWGGLDAEVRRRLVEQIGRSALAYVGLRRVPGLGGVRLRRAHLVEYWQRPGPRPHEIAEARDENPHADPDARALEGLVSALLAELHQPHGGDEAQQTALKELLIEAARAVANCYAWQALPYLRPGDLSSASGLIDALLRCFDHAPRELAQALGVDPAQGLPRLRGGQVGALERRFRRLHREVLRGRKAKGGEGVTYVCKPLPKEVALARGMLGRDCSSFSVPLRALSPHHVYYGIFDEAGQQQQGYLTVYEAWACTKGGAARPMLCLETINEPKGLLGGAQQDLLVIFEAIARSRGLHPGLVLITDRGTWNYANGSELARCRRVRRGTPVWLSPADPVTWRIYQRVCVEARHYSAFDGSYDGGGMLLRHDVDGGEGRSPMALLAPFDPEHDVVRPENLAEARRLASLPPRELRVTCRDEQGDTLGFISGLARVRLGAACRRGAAFAGDEGRKHGAELALVRLAEGARADRA